MHLTLGTARKGVRTSQAVFHALSFFWLDGFAVPASAQVSPIGDDSANRWAVAMQNKDSMKIKEIFTVLFTSFILASCAPKIEVAQTETAYPTFTPTVTVMPLPTATPTPIEVAGAKLLPFIEADGNGGWSINKAALDPNNVVGFSADNEPGGGTYPAYGPEGAGETSIRCIAEITTPSGEKVTTGLIYWQRLTQINPATWNGIRYILGEGLGRTTQPGKVGCTNLVNSNIEGGRYTTSMNLIYNPNTMMADALSMMTPIIAELAPPPEFWTTGNIALLPKVNGKPFLLITDASFNQ